MKQFRVGIDCRFWGIEHAGLGRYTRQLVLTMLNQSISGSGLDWVLFFQKNKWRQDKKQLLGAEIIEVEIPHYSLQEQLRLGRIFDREDLDLLHVPHFNVPVLVKTPFVVTIHDLIKHFFKGRSVTTRALPLYWLKHWAYRGVIGQAISRSAQILAPSYFAKDQILIHYRVPESKLTVTYEGVSRSFLGESRLSKNRQQNLLKKYRLEKPFFVYTGSAYPFKDLPTLLRAIKLVNRRNQKAQLIIACSRNVFWERLKKEVDKLDLELKVRLPGQVSDDDLKGLYQQAAAFVTPSLMEGFGLPGLEAMSSGCLVIAAKAGSLEEVYGPGAIYFKPQNEVDLKGKLDEVLGMDSKKRQKQVALGKKQAAKYSWEKTAGETLEVYHKVLVETENR